jgi:hypothetical protein
LIGTPSAPATLTRTAREGLASPDSKLAIAKLRIVDALLTGAHEPDTSHHALLSAFLDERQVDDELAANRYRTHEFGDPVLVERGVGSMVGRTEYTHRRIA